ncbi:MAG: tRNA (adenosine(37)-N6)-threonylcarbamoyltransferase complex ATPase subunit type 1 TsaE [Bacteroidaceae bacterium]|nr:tRNA (adenosine(37)-N6)-threonylcarbamoyltransferase complex ATPase subunit type 1 TsaE [Bacteroidaceae bacterium]
MEIKINDIGSIAQAARQFVEAMGDRRVFAFYGKMGAGKTTFIKAICEALGVEDVVTSPTFAIVNEYGVNEERSSFNKVFHFDFYRIKSLREAYDIGTEEYFYSGSPCFIEWPELVEPLLPEETVSVSIEVNPDGTRSVTVTP